MHVQVGYLPDPLNPPHRGIGLEVATRYVILELAVLPILEPLPIVHTVTQDDLLPSSRHHVRLNPGRPLLTSPSSFAFLSPYRSSSSAPPVA